eukprot:tig00021517_g22008.t1
MPPEGGSAGASVLASPNLLPSSIETSSVAVLSLAEDRGSPPPPAAAKGRSQSLSAAMIPGLHAAAEAAAAPTGESQRPAEPIKQRRGPGGAGALRRVKRRLAAWVAPFLSIRVLFILSAVLQVVSACGFTFAIMWVLGQRNVESMAGNYLGELQERTFFAAKAYLDRAKEVAESSADFAARGLLTPANWRASLETFVTSFERFSEIALNSVMFANGTFFGSEAGPFRPSLALAPPSPPLKRAGTEQKCYKEELGGACPAGSRTIFGNRTHYVYFTNGRRGQPTGHPIITMRLTPQATSWYGATVNSSAGALWFPARYTSVPPGAAANPLDAVVVTFATAFRNKGSVQAELANYTGGLPGTPSAYPGPATPASWLESTPGPYPIGGAVSVYLRIGALSRQLRDAVSIPGTLLFLTTSAGRMFATSTSVFEHVINVKTGAVLASESPDPLTRDAARAFTAPLGPSSGPQRLLIRCAGRDYFGMRAPLHVDPNLDLVLYIAVPRDVVMSELQGAVTIELIVNGVWLAVCICVAVLISWGITRPIGKIRGSMQILLETMTAVYAEMRMHVNSAAPPLPGPPASSEGGGQLESRRGTQSVSFSSSGGHSNVHLRELTAFDDLVSDMYSRFVSFQEVVSTEAKAKIEMEVRSEETKKFLATVSHEMRTPLNGLLGMLDLARECELPQEAAEYIEAASLSGDHLLALLNDILDLQKMEAGLIELSSAPVDVRSAVVNAVRIVKRKADEKGLSVSMDVADHVPLVVFSDPDRLRQVLLNLLSNAVKYTLRGAIDVRVSIPPLPAMPISMREPRTSLGRPGRIVLRFEIMDSGPGIALEHQLHLFQRFYRVQHPSGTQNDPGGTGLGLAISREIVEKAGGRIGCTSTLGEGSCFWFELPCRYDRSPPGSDGIAASQGVRSTVSGALSPRVSVNRRQSSFPSADGSNSHKDGTNGPAETERPSTSVCGSAALGSSSLAPVDVLVAEDNVMSARVVTQMLRKEGHRVTLATNGAEVRSPWETLQLG